MLWIKIHRIWIRIQNCWPNLDPDPGLYYKFWRKIKINNKLKENNLFLKTKIFFKFYMIISVCYSLWMVYPYSEYGAPEYGSTPLFLWLHRQLFSNCKLFYISLSPLSTFPHFSSCTVSYFSSCTIPLLSCCTVNYSSFIWLQTVNYSSFTYLAAHCQLFLISLAALSIIPHFSDCTVNYSSFL